MLGNIPESDWHHFKRVHQVLLERFCQRTLDDLGAMLRASEGSAHEQYRRAYELLVDRDEELARAFDDFRRNGEECHVIQFHRRYRGGCFQRRGRG